MVKQYTRLSRKSNLISALVNNEVVMMDAESGKYFGLNGVASQIWQFLENPICFEELVYQLQEAFLVDASICQTETHEFITEMVNLGLVETCTN